MCRLWYKLHSLATQNQRRMYRVHKDDPLLSWVTLLLSKTHKVPVTTSCSSCYNTHWVIMTLWTWSAGNKLTTNTNLYCQKQQHMEDGTECVNILWTQYFSRSTNTCDNYGDLNQWMCPHIFASLVLSYHPARHSHNYKVIAVFCFIHTKNSAHGSSRHF